MTEYIYPFQRGVEVTASNPLGRYAHENHLESEHAIDFLLPIGTPIVASRRGTVVTLKHDSDRYVTDINELEGMTAEEVIEFAEKYTNFVCIGHDDGAFSEYCHLDKRAVVKKDQEVEQGYIIGYCGMSGLTVEPHLHFNVFKLENGETRSVSVEFS